MIKEAGLYQRGAQVAKFLLGENIPKWMYPATAFVAAAPVVGNVIETKLKNQALRNQIPLMSLMQRRSTSMNGAQLMPSSFYSMQNSMPPRLPAYNPSVMKYGADESAMEKSAAAIGRRLGEKQSQLQGIENLKKLMLEAKAKGRNRHALAVDETPANIDNAEASKSARGISSGAAVSGNGGGYGR
jgi:hypothetical protein